MWLSVEFEDEDTDEERTSVSPDSTPLDLSPTQTMATGQTTPPDGNEGAVFAILKTDPDQSVTMDSAFDPERSADREAVALAMVTDLTKATGILPSLQNGGLAGMSESQLFLPRKKQRKRPREDEKICTVCGDKALAHNFDAITCESCKAFFRRNAFRIERLSCLFSGECEITMQTRRFCPACRLKKCFAVGMKADLILDDSERKARMDKVSENRAKRMAKDGSDCWDAQVGSSSSFSSSSAHLITMVSLSDVTPAVISHSSPLPSTTPLPLPPTAPITVVGPKEGEATLHCHRPSAPQRSRSVEGSVQNGMPTLHAVLTAATLSSVETTPVFSGVVPTTAALLHKPPSQPSTQQLTTTPTPTPPPSHPPQQPPPPPPPSQRSGISAGEESRKTPPGQPDFQHVSRDLLPSDPHMYWRLSEEEKTLLTQLSSAYQATIMTLPERVPCEGGDLLGGGGGDQRRGDSFSLQSVEHIFETSEKNMRQIIDFVQRLTDFHVLREDDKMAILQASCMRSMILRWTGLYVVERHTWLTRFGECSVETASKILGHADIITQLAAFCRATKCLLKNDVTLFVLLHCLLLFDPREPSLVDRQLVNAYRDKYLVLLKHYLESEYSFLFAEHYLQAVLGKVAEARPLAERCVGIMEEFQEFVPPLTRQLLNLHESR